MRHFLATICFLLLTTLATPQPRPPLPASVDLVAEYKKLGLTPEAQGDRDVCSLFAITSVADLEAARHFGAQQKRLSPEWLIWAARKSTGHKGDQSMFFEAVHGLNSLGICTEDLVPYRAKPNNQPKLSKAASASRQGTRPAVEGPFHQALGRQGAAY